jgi:glycosyltransferase involved in cell wall biosynthesis
MFFSIITINYNNLNGLIKTVNSVINQSLKDFEFIVIDGGSTDGSVEFIKDNQDHIDYWVSEKDNGIYHAMNKGIEVAKGEYCLFLNSGDCLIDDLTLNKVCNKINTVDLIFFNYFDQKIKKEFLSFSDFWFQTPYCHQAIFFKKSVFDDLGLYNEKLKIVADWEIILRAIYYKKKYKIFNEEIVIVEQSGISNTNEGSVIAQNERLQILLNDYPFFYNDFQNLSYFKKSKIFRLVNKLLIFVNKGVSIE